MLMYMFLVGQKFAMLEMQTIISGILKEYELYPVDTPSSITLIQDVVLRSKNGIKIKFRRRKWYNNNRQSTPVTNIFAYAHFVELFVLLY